MDLDRGQELEHPVRRPVAKPLLPRRVAFPACWTPLTKTLPARTSGRKRAPSSRRHRPCAMSKSLGHQDAFSARAGALCYRWRSRTVANTDSNLEHTAGGSSGGAACAAAAGLSPLAEGTAAARFVSPRVAVGRSD